MRITGTAVTLNVADVPASSEFLQKHFGFREVMSADGFASLTREDAGMHIGYLAIGLPTLPADFRDIGAAGVLVAFEVDDLPAEERRLRAEGVPITHETTVEPWGERFFQVTDPNGVIVQLVDWVSAKPTS